VKAANLGLRFLLELCLLAALAYVGLQVNVVLAVVFPVVAAVVWGMFVSPKARYPLGTGAWVGLQVALFVCAVVGLIVAGSVVLGVVFGVVVAANLSLVLFWHQRDTVT
jgi:hypothetical protein